MESKTGNPTISRVININISATETIESIDMFVWHLLWLVIPFLIMWAVGDLYHARNGTLRYQEDEGNEADLPIQITQDLSSSNHLITEV